MDDIVSRLRKIRLVVDNERTLNRIGVITGSIEEQFIQEIAEVEGVLGFEAVHSYELPPAESEIQ